MAVVVSFGTGMKVRVRVGLVIAIELGREG